MINLINYIKIFEGGAGGHMAHPYDYVEFTGQDLIEFIDDLFSGKIEHMKEKLDGFNIEATKNKDNKTVFIRNKTDRNSENGGMSIEDIKTKWEGKEHQQKTFLTAATIISQIFDKIDKSFFIIDETHKKTINCECIVEGNTNIIPYATDRVAFHGYKIYEWNGEKWVEQEDVEGHVEELYKAAKGIDQAKPRPDLVIKSQEEANKLAEKFKKEVIKLWKAEKLELNATIDEWKHTRFVNLSPKWMKDDNDIYNRIFNGDKSINLGILKKRYPDHIEELSKIDKDKDLFDKVSDPLNNLFLAIGNEVIDIMDGFVNSESKDKIIASLKNELSSTISIVNKGGNETDQKKLMKALERLKMLGDKFNTAEGIVIVYKGRRMKLTGSFAPLNQALGLRFNYENNEQ